MAEVIDGFRTLAYSLIFLLGLALVGVNVLLWRVWALERRVRVLESKNIRYR